jgi:hypothetical protein
MLIPKRTLRVIDVLQRVSGGRGAIRNATTAIAAKNLNVMAQTP